MLLLGCTREEIEFFDMLNEELETVEQFYKGEPNALWPSQCDFYIYIYIYAVENEIKLVERLELIKKQCEIIATYEQRHVDGSAPTLPDTRKRLMPAMLLLKHIILICTTYAYHS